MSRPESPNNKVISLLQVKGLIDALEEITQDSATNSENTQESCPFSVGKVPKINLESYFNRIIKYCKIQEGSFIAMMIYLDKAAEKIDLTAFNIHRLILGSLVCAMKYTCDVCSNNIFFAKVGGVTPNEMCVIESAFLVLMNYNLYIKDEEYERYYCFIRG